MGLDSIIRNGVAIAHRITSSLQETVRHSAWVGADGYGKPIYAASIERQAVVNFRQRLRRNFDGAEIMQVATVLFLEPFAANGAAGRREPVDPRDLILLPNGHVGIVVDVDGFVDVSTSAPFFCEVSLG